MKRHILIGIPILTALLATVLVLHLPASAAPASSVSPSLPVAPEVSPPLPADYLLALPVVPPDPAEVPPGLTPEEAAEYARSLTYRQAGPLLAELEALQAAGRIAGFEVRPDLHGVVVEGATPDVLEGLSRLPEIAALMPYSGDAPPACAVAAAQALPEQVLGLSRMAVEQAFSIRTAGVTPQATDPSINVQVPPDSTGTGSTWTYISGYTTPNTAVIMRILRGGRVIATQSTTSSGSGYYSFYPSWQQCPTYGYSWGLRSGDVVEVSAQGRTVSTVVADMRVWVDPGVNTVTGRTEPGRSVEVWLYSYGGDPCNSTSYSQTVSTDSGGNFNANFSSQVDFDRKASATIYARDANGNSTYYWFYAYRIYAYFNTSSFGGYLKPEVDYTATLRRGGNVVSVASGRTSATNYFGNSFTQTIQAGDVISVTGGGLTVQYTATGLSVAMDHVNNRATGTTGANRLVQASFRKRTWGDMVTSCSSSSTCKYTTASSSGQFTLTAGMDLARGDYAYFYIYDNEGNYQYAYQYPVPAIAADPGTQSIRGYWGRPGTNLTVRVKQPDGTPVYTATSVYASSGDGNFSTYVGSGLVTPTYTVEVTDGTVTETMTVQNLTARLDGGTGRLTGSAASGHLLARLYDFRRESPDYYWVYYWVYCAEKDVNGSYDITFSEAQVGGQDYVSGMWLRGSDGHYTARQSLYAFTVNAGGNRVDGYTETPYATVTATLQRSGSPVAVVTTTSGSSGWYRVYLDSGTTITTGDTIQVQTSDGDSVSIPVPLLTANKDGANNRIYGKAPANEPVRPQARRWYKWGWYSIYQNAVADNSGNYSASFNGLYWYRSGVCYAVDMGHRCAQAAVYYYRPDGHQVWIEGAPPQPVGPDIYESDDITATARAYTGVQSHTFHTVTDTDWVTFTVPQADVDNGVPYRIETFNLGWGMGTQVTLYDANLNWQGEWWGYEYQGRGVSARWTPTVSGTYYLEIRPPSESYAAYCDAVYDLMILPERARVFLPLVLRNYP